MRRITCGVLAVLAAVLPTKLLAEDVALLIANTQGAGFPQERQINAELGSVAEAYRADGFTVLVDREIGLTGMKNAFRRFEVESRDADRVVIHVIGGLIVTDHNIHFKPSDFSSNSMVDRHTGGIGLDLAYDLLAHRPGRSALVVAHAQPDIVNRIEAGPHIPQGLLVISGNGRNTNKAIRDGMLKGDETALEIASNYGVSAVGFVSDFALTPRERNATRRNDAASSALIEMEVWRAAAQNGSERALQAYIDRYPNGLFRGEAESRLAALNPPKPVEQTVEERLNLSRSDRRAIQENLTLLGFSTRGVDGLFGAGTRAAIERWQRTEGFRATGYLDNAQIRVLNESAKAKAEANRVSREREDLAYWQQTGSGTNERGLRDYLAKYPDGLFSDQAKQALSRIEQSSQDPKKEAIVAREKALNMTPKTRQLVEQRLVGLGYDVGPVDGRFTRETRIAIRSFQQKAGITPTGYMDNQTVTRLVASIFR